ncbi:hypothetical protein TNCV_1346191 [Trichonephila clavipes]|nr:hypothetical protein TNCV_1346191 [Trichonephila clavipes]
MCNGTVPRDASLEEVDRRAPNNSKTGVLMPASSICRSRCLLHRGLRAMVPLYRIPSLQTIDSCVCNGFMSIAPRQTDWNQVVFSDESRFNLWGYDGRIPV